VIRPFHLNSDKIVHCLQPTPPQVPGLVSTLTANKVLGFRGGLRDGCVNLCSMGRIAEEEGAEDAGPLPRDAVALAMAKATGLRSEATRARFSSWRRRATLASAARRSTRAKSRVADLGVIITDIRASEVVSLRQTAAALNERRIKTARGRTGQRFRSSAYELG
jgi:hypothetical protein